MKRRDFIKWQGRGLLGLGLGLNLPWVTEISAQGQGQSKSKNPGPLVLSTWDYGLKTNEVAWRILKKGGYALDALVAGAELAEMDPENAYVGLGGFPDRDGIVTLDASVMDHQYNMGMVAGLEQVPRASALARAVMERTPHTLLVGDGALQFAKEQGFETMNLLTPSSEAAWKRWLETSRYLPGVNVENHDTIGLLSLDQEGRMAGVCTTSGMAYKMHGRVGDTPLIGSGLYVDPEVGAVTSTGHGEEIVRAGGSLLVLEGMRNGLDPEQACRNVALRVLKQLRHRSKDPAQYQACFMALTKDGRYGACSLQPGFTYAVQDEDQGNRLIQAPHAWSKL
ncbi:MAG: N(4)-(beta-N-acetylglucosaminyl)-L-asparaginase [Bacteroidota bacterium]|jgi:N4-(beta-N-acetylglucosaminyl)-L-asparaginase